MNLNDEVICGHLVTTEQKKTNLVFLDLIQEFERLCREHDIQYYMFFGGLIGAVRHKGFIPWDDDVDLIVPRKDFNRLACMTQKQFGAKEPYFLQNPVTDPASIDTLVRFRRSDTTSIREVDWEDLETKKIDPPYNLGLGLTILPLDNVPRGKISKRVQFCVSGVLSAMFYRAYEPASEKPFRWFISRIPAVLLGYRNFFLLRHLPYRLCGKNRSGMVQVFDGFYRSSTAFEIEDFREVIQLPFEDITVPAPIGYDRILRRTYGDYMQFPPEEKRCPPHNAISSADTAYPETIARLRSGEMSVPEDWSSSRP